ncbi:response regulator [Flavobacteriaceae bacterium R38]|nr:response regulator [Flavobacteriaceae bacterium R38]
MRTNYFIRVIFFLLFFSGVAQENNSSVIDSIKSYLYNARSNQHKYDIRKSIEYCNKVIELSQKINNDEYLVRAYNMVGASYEQIADFKNAEKNYQKALLKTKNIDNDTLVSWVYNNLGNVYSDGYKETDRGISYYNKALSILKKLNDTVEVLTPTINIAWTYIDAEKFDDAFPYLQEARNYSKNYEVEEIAVSLNYLLGRYYVHKKEFDIALEHFEASILSGEKKGMFLELSDVYLEQSKLFEALNDNDKAFIAFKKYDASRKEVLDKEKIKQLEIAKAKFDVDEFERDLGKARKENAIQTSNARKSKIITIISIVIVFILIILLIVLYKNYETKNELSNILKIQNANLEKSKAEAEKLSQLKSQFISTVSHELRTPLYGVVGITSLLMEESDLSKKENQYLKSLKFSSDYLLNLINDVLQLSKIDSNKLKLEKTDFSVQALLDNVMSSFEYLLDQKNNKLNLEIDKELPCTLKGDTIRLQQILVNLVGNATKFTNDGEIWLRLRLLKIADNIATVNFEIEDNGIGIPKEKQKEIFDNFLQIERKDADFQGTGLGLSIVKRLVTLFGGEVNLKSEPGIGSIFSFTLDLQIGKPLSEDEICQEVYENVHLNNKILIVDDNKINQVVTQNILKKEKFKTVVVDNGLSAVEKIKQDHFDLVLMDLNMPVMNGFEATQKIREFNESVPIIALTAVAIDEIKDQVYKAGLNDIINKPYDNQDFFQIILRNLAKNEVSES